MRRGRLLIALGVAAYLLFLGLTFPAAVAYQWFAPEALRVQGIRGSVWSGSAVAASWDGVPLVDPQWRARPLAVFSGRIAFRLSGKLLPEGFVDGTFAVSPFGTLRVSELRLAAPLGALAGILPGEVPSGMFDARVELRLDDARLVGGWPERAVGVLDLSDLRMTSPMPQALGDYRIEFAGNGEAGALRGDFHDVRGPLAIQGSLTLNPDRTYAIECEATAREDAPAELKNSIGFFCQGRERG